MKTELGKTMEMLSVLAQMGDTNYVRQKGKELKKVWEDSYTPKKDSAIMNYLTKEEQEEFLSIS